LRIWPRLWTQREAQRQGFPKRKMAERLGQSAFVDENRVLEMGMDQNNPRISFCGMWADRDPHWGRTSGGPGSGLFKRPTARQWSGWRGMGCRISEGRIAVRVAKKDSSRGYAEMRLRRSPAGEQALADGQLWRRMTSARRGAG